MDPVLTVTLNPALDVSTSTDELSPGRKLRCDSPRFDPGGGGINVSRAIKELGGESRAFVLLGGAPGDKLLGLLEDEGIETVKQELEGDTRISVKVLERSSGEQYRFVLPGPEQSADRADTLISQIVDRANAEGYRFVVASGSLPPGFPEDLYAQLASRLREIDVKLVLDTSGPPLRAALAGRPWLIKPDRHEAAELVKLTNESSKSVESLAETLWRQGAAEVVIVTLGAEGAIVVAEDVKARIRPPKVEALSTVGAGDSFIGALVLGLARNWPLGDAVRYGVAAAASAVETEATTLCRRSSTENYFEAIADKLERL